MKEGNIFPKVKFGPKEESGSFATIEWPAKHIESTGEGSNKFTALLDAAAGLIEEIQSKPQDNNT